MGDAAYGEGGFGAEDEGVALVLLAGDVAEFLVVHLVAAFPGGDECGIAAEVATDEPPVAEGLLLVVGGLGEDDEVATEALLLEVAQGDGIGNAAVDEQLVADGHDPGDYGHGGGGEDPVVELLGEAVEAAIDGLAGKDVGADEMELHGAAVESGDVEGVETLGKGVVGKTGAEDSASGEQRPEAAVAGVVGVAQVIAQDASGLSALVVTAEAGSGGNADESVEGYVELEEHVKDACGEKSTHGTAFQYQSCLHCGGGYAILSVFGLKGIDYF